MPVLKGLAFLAVKLIVENSSICDTFWGITSIYIMEIAVKRITRTKAIDWEVVYQTYIGKVFNFFRYRLGDDALAEDLTGQTFEKAWKRRRQFRGTMEHLPAWLFTIARKCAARPLPHA